MRLPRVSGPDTPAVVRAGRKLRVLTRAGMRAMSLLPAHPRCEARAVRKGTGRSWSYHPCGKARTWPHAERQALPSSDDLALAYTEFEGLVLLAEQVRAVTRVELGAVEEVASICPRSDSNGALSAVLRHPTRVRVSAAAQCMKTDWNWTAVSPSPFSTNL